MASVSVFWAAASGKRHDGFLMKSAVGMGALLTAARVASLRTLDKTSAEVVTMESQPMMTRSEEHTSELQSLMRISYAVFCLKKKNPQLQLTLSHHNLHPTTTSS